MKAEHAESNCSESNSSDYSFWQDDSDDVYSFEWNGEYQDCDKTMSDGYLRILDLREGNEENPAETSGGKASVFAGFDDCPRVEKFIKLLDFRHFDRFYGFDRSDRNTYKKAISDDLNVSVVLHMVSGNTSKYSS